jgi:hypothetical protein
MYKEEFDFMSKYKVLPGSPACKVEPGHAVPLSDEEFYSHVLKLNEDNKGCLDIVKDAIRKTREFQRLANSNHRSGDEMVNVLLENAHALLRVRGYEKIKVHQAFSAISSMVAYKRKKRLLMQISTGEGKTDIGRLVASCIHKLEHDMIDIVTSSKTLAEEEIEASKKFYEQVGMEVDSGIDFHKRFKTKEERDANNIFLNKHVLIGTVHDMSCNQLNDRINNCRYQPVADTIGKADAVTLVGHLLASAVLGDSKYYSDCRQKKYIIVDEVDSMFVDSKTGLTSLVSERKNLIKFDIVSSMIWAATVSINEEGISEADYILKVIKDVEANPMFEKLKLGEIDTEKWNNCSKIYAQNAYIALYKFKEDEQYIIDDGKIVPVDIQGTGEIQQNSKWNNYLHSFVEMKHNLKVTRQNNCATSKSVSAFFEDYDNKIFGITGTLGDESCINFLKKAYNVETIIVPKCNKNRMINYEPIFGLHTKEECPSASQELLDFCYNSLRMGRPCLVISNTIREAKELSSFVPDYLINRYKEEQRDHPDIASQAHHLNHINNQLYTHSTEEKLKEKAKKIPKNTIIFGTNLASRGTDVTFSGDTHAGGLSVIYTYLPLSSRVEDQIRGRAARNGDNGCNIYIAQDITFTEESIKVLKKLKADGREKEYKDATDGAIREHRQRRENREAEEMLESYEDVIRFRESDSQQKIYQTMVRNMEEEERKQEKNSEEKAPEGARKSVIFKSVMDDLLEIENICGLDDPTAVIKSKNRYKPRPMNEIISQAKTLITYSNSYLDPRRPVDKLCAELKFKDTYLENNRHLEKLEELKKESGVTDKKYCRLVKVMILNNKKEYENAKKELEEVQEEELEEAASYQLTFKAALTAMHNRNICRVEEILKQNGLENRLIRVSKTGTTESLTNEGANISQESMILFNDVIIKQMITELRPKNKELAKIMDEIDNIEATGKNIDQNTMESLAASSEDYNRLKAFGYNTILNNIELRQKKEEDDTKKLIYNNERGDGIGIYGIIASSGKKGYLGYILGGLCIAVGVALMVFTPICPVVSFEIGLNLFSSGLDMIHKNDQDNKSGNYSTGSTLKNAFVHITASIVSPLAKYYGNMLGKNFVEKIFSKEVVEKYYSLVNMLSKKSTMMALTMKAMNAVGIEVSKDDIAFGFTLFAEKSGFTEVIQSAKGFIQNLSKSREIMQDLYKNLSDSIKEPSNILSMITIDKEILIETILSFDSSDKDFFNKLLDSCKKVRINEIFGGGIRDSITSINTILAAVGDHQIPNIPDINDIVKDSTSKLKNAISHKIVETVGSEIKCPLLENLINKYANKFVESIQKKLISEGEKLYDVDEDAALSKQAALRKEFEDMKATVNQMVEGFNSKQSNIKDLVSQLNGLGEENKKRNETRNNKILEFNVCNQQSEAGKKLLDDINRLEKEIESAKCHYGNLHTKFKEIEAIVTKERTEVEVAQKNLEKKCFDVNQSIQLIGTTLNEGYARVKEYVQKKIQSLGTIACKFLQTVIEHLADEIKVSIDTLIKDKKFKFDYKNLLKKSAQSLTQTCKEELKNVKEELKAICMEMVESLKAIPILAEIIEVVTLLLQKGPLNGLAIYSLNKVEDFLHGARRDMGLPD